MPSTSVTFNIGNYQFDVELELLAKYPNSLLSKCVQNSNTDEDQSFNIDRDGKYFFKILSFMRDEDSLVFRRMSNIDMDILKAEARYYNIEEMVESIDNYRTPEKFGYDELELVKDLDSLLQVLTGETRFVIFLDYQEYIADENAQHRIRYLMSRVDRNRFLFLLLLFESGDFASKIYGKARSIDTMLHDESNRAFISLKNATEYAELYAWLYITMADIRNK